jgi:hypothetical protein
MKTFSLLVLGLSSLTFAVDGLSPQGAGATGGENPIAVAPFHLECKVQFTQSALEVEKDVTATYVFTEKNFQFSEAPGPKGFSLSATPVGGRTTPQRLQVLIELNGVNQNGSYSGIESFVTTSGESNSLSTALGLKTESEFPDVLRRRTLQIDCTDKSL